MKVLNYGRKWEHISVCRCGCEMLVEQADLKRFCRQGYDFTGEANGPVLEGVQCPTCGRWLEVKR